MSLLFAKLIKASFTAKPNIVSIFFSFDKSWSEQSKFAFELAFETNDWSAMMARKVDG